MGSQDESICNPIGGSVTVREGEQEEIKASYRRFCDLITSTFPPCKPARAHGLTKGQNYRHKDDGWCGSVQNMAGAMVAQKYFVARPSDVFIATSPKSGTTWIKALVHTVVNRHRSFPSRLPPHQQIRFLESQVYTEGGVLDVGTAPLEPSPRVFSTHVPYPSLPNSITEGGCRVVYMWRDPKDILISLWEMANSYNNAKRPCVEPVPLEEAFDWFCDGESWFGPFWDHVVGYWNALAKHDANVLFLRYEDVAADPVRHLKRLAEFLGRPFTLKEEREGVAEDIVHRCSFESMRNSEVNTSGATEFGGMTFENTLFFRKGKVGDHANYLTPAMVEKMDSITREKFSAAGIPL